MARRPRAKTKRGRTDTKTYNHTAKYTQIQPHANTNPCTDMQTQIQRHQTHGQHVTRKTKKTQPTYKTKYTPKIDPFPHTPQTSNTHLEPPTPTSSFLVAGDDLSPALRLPPALPPPLAPPTPFPLGVAFVPTVSPGAVVVAPPPPTPPATVAAEAGVSVVGPAPTAPSPAAAVARLAALEDEERPFDFCLRVTPG